MTIPFRALTPSPGLVLISNLLEPGIRSFAVANRIELGFVDEFQRLEFQILLIQIKLKGWEIRTEKIKKRYTLKDSTANIRVVVPPIRIGKRA